MSKNTSPLTETIRIIRLNFQREERLHKIAATLPAHLRRRFLVDHNANAKEIGRGPAA